jgi:hypothetical protein
MADDEPTPTKGFKTASDQAAALWGSPESRAARAAATNERATVDPTKGTMAQDTANSQNLISRARSMIPDHDFAFGPPNTQ